MPYYYVSNYDVTDRSKFAQYARQSGAILEQYGAKILVADQMPVDLVGKSRQWLMVLEFESKEAAMRWYRSPEYEAIKGNWLEASEGWVRIAPEFVPPAR